MAVKELFEVSFRSEKGSDRDNNEDSLEVLRWDTCQSGNTSRHGLIALADGVGGSPRGHLASRMGMLGFCRNFLGMALTDLPIAPADMIRRGFESSNSEVIRASKRTEGSVGMATTLTIVYFVDNMCYVGHVGDSRCYLVRNGEIRQITPDQVSGGILQQELGDEVAPTPFQASVEILANDCLVVCSDGLWSKVNESQIIGIIGRNEETSKACDLMVSEAIERGGTDDVSVVVVRILPPDEHGRP